MRSLGCRGAARWSRRGIFARYAEAFGEVAGLELQPEADSGRHNRWLTCLTVDAEAFGATNEQIRLHLEALDIEARPVWKPMHLQPVFAERRAIGGAVAQELFDHGLCLPSGSQMTEDDVDRVVSAVLSTPRGSE